MKSFKTDIYIINIIKYQDVSIYCKKLIGNFKCLKLIAIFKPICRIQTNV